MNVKIEFVLAELVKSKMNNNIENAATKAEFLFPHLLEDYLQI